MKYLYSFYGDIVILTREIVSLLVCIFIFNCVSLWLKKENGLQ